MSRRSKWLECAWVAHRLELVQSPSWRLAPVPLRRLIDRLEIEHMRHAGQLNGQLFVSFGQLELAGISRRSILGVLQLGAELGLVETIRQANPLGDIRSPNSYRLAYLPAKGKSSPTDEWKLVGEGQVVAAIDTFRQKERGYQTSKSAKREAA